MIRIALLYQFYKQGSRFGEYESHRSKNHRFLPLTFVLIHRHTNFVQVYKDERLPQLDAIPEFQSHSSVLTKMYLNRIVQKRELEQFESSLASHQRAVMADGLTIVERGEFSPSA